MLSEMEAPALLLIVDFFFKVTLSKSTYFRTWHLDFPLNVIWFKRKIRTKSWAVFLHLMGKQQCMHALVIKAYTRLENDNKLIVIL